MLAGVFEDGGDGVGAWRVVLPLLAPFRRLRRRGGREGVLSGEFFRLCFSGRLWWRGEKEMVVLDPFLVVRLEVVFFDALAPAGRGGEGSGVWRRAGVGGGRPGRNRVGWVVGGAGETALWPCAFIASRFRCEAADGSCGQLRHVEALLPRRLEVRRRRQSLGSWELVFGSDCFSFSLLRVLRANFRVLLFFLFFGGLACNLY